MSFLADWLLGSFILERNICCHSEGLKHHTITLEWKGCMKSNFRSHQHESFLFLSAKIWISQLFTFHLNCKYHPWGLINDMQISIYNRKHWHAFAHSLHFVRHEGDWPTNLPSPASKSGSRLPSPFNSVCLALVPRQIDSPYLIIMSWITIPRDEYYALHRSSYLERQHGHNFTTYNFF